MLAIPSQFLTQLGMMRLDASKACVELVDVPLVLIGAFGWLGPVTPVAPVNVRM